ncbi:DUF2252 domain-containing protein [Sphaerospermopsis aphanizomenoides BCCUSP55]|uniref:DUF2252 domain-containing protein n=1 Tax=Sphaerospermopsis aphanizomenoides TaxID=459663 RepID=UPI001902DB76|nr:DUF2252 domain-containing protein [Sphaerospermopsis aphanizomenoides]MBK1986587.1 DUF2252 domain-containing protein [Sphaerospermopsis aphanizomenoides BCCUSP55]
MSNNIKTRIDKFNHGRDPELLQLKYKKLSTDPFSFFRGTCHLFYEDLPQDSSLNSAPLTWICGDLHLENFGSYKGDNRLVYFDINDFDESVLAPCTYDLVRFITSIIVGSHAVGINDAESLHLSEIYLNTYTATLAEGKPRTVEKETAKGLVKDLLESLQKRERPKFLDKYTKEKNGKRWLDVEKKRIMVAEEAEQEKVKKLILHWHHTTNQNPDFYQIIDVQKRIAGNGSLGLERYLILVEGTGSPDGNYLLDFKETHPSSLQPYVKVSQPQWETPGARVVAIQKRFQGTPPALLEAINDGEKSYVLRELQPEQDKVSLQAWDGKIGRLEKLIQTMAQVTAWDQLRSSGRQGSAIADELIDFAQSSEWHNSIIEYARNYAEKVNQDFQEFCQS